MSNVKLTLHLEDLLHEFQRMLALFLRLHNKELRQKRQVLPLKVRRNAYVFQVGGEFVTDLRVEGRRRNRD